MWKTEGLKQALDQYGFDAAFGGARRDEEKSRAKERIFSFRDRKPPLGPEAASGRSCGRSTTCARRRARASACSRCRNWTELDVWQYILREKIEIVPLYFAAERPVVERDGLLLMVDDERMPLEPARGREMRRVRFRTLGCYPLTGAVESDAATRRGHRRRDAGERDQSERQGRAIDRDAGARAWRRRSRRAISDGRRPGRRRRRRCASG